MEQSPSAHAMAAEAVEAEQFYPGAKIVWAAIAALKRMYALEAQQDVPDSQPEEFDY